jgi:dipeptidyl aminopeptidase/acylaminoacyl peptidase
MDAFHMTFETKRATASTKAITHVMRAVFALAAGVTCAAPASKSQHIFMEAVISPDGRNVVSVEGDSSAAGGSPVQRDLVIRSTGGKRQQIVDLPCGRVVQCWPSDMAWTADSRKISFALRTPGRHARSIYQVNSDGSNLAQLAAFDGTIAALRYSPDGQLAMLATAGATKELSAVEAGAAIGGDLDAVPPEQRIAVLDAGRLRFASPPELFVYEYDWRPDGRGFVGTAAAGDGDKNWWIAKLYVFDARDGTARVLYSPSSAQQQLAAPIVSPDGKRVAFIAGIMSDFGSTGGDVYSVAFAGGTAADVTPKLPASVSELHWGCNGHLIATALAGDKTEFVDIGDGQLGKAVRVLWQGQEAIGARTTQLAAACPSGTMALVHEWFTRPEEIEIGSVGKWHDLTHSNAGVTAPFKVQSLSWKSDEFTVQGWLLLPQERAAGTKLPLVTIVHGGPAAAFESAFVGAGSTRLLLEHGYAVLLPNPRGSYGQGEVFTVANVRDFGYGDLRDILAGIDAAAGAGPVDADRVGIMGHSYGGFMTMWAVTQTNRFKAAVAGAGIANWQSYYGENGIDEWMIPYFGASVYDDPAVYAKSSAIDFIRQVRTPTFSYVGAADIECPAAQTLEFGHALKVLGVPSVTIVYPDEGHAIHDPAHLADRSERTLAWFDRYLK